MEAIVESLDEQLVEAYCGEKHAHGNGEERLQRAAIKTRSAVTTAGDHEFALTYVEDTAADQHDQSCFRPIEDLIPFDSQRQYHEDISAKSVDFATSLSYRDATDHGDSLVSMLSPATINRRVKEHGNKLKQVQLFPR